MSLQNWLNEGKLKLHTTTPNEIESLFKVIDRDIADANIIAVSADRRFATAYNAALQLATVALLVSGYRPVASRGHHFITINSLQFTIPKIPKARIHYLNACRQLRNKTDYDRAGVTEEEEVVELLEEVTTFRKDVLEWLQKYHSKLSSFVGFQKPPL